MARGLALPEQFKHLDQRLNVAGLVRSRYRHLITPRVAAQLADHRAEVTLRVVRLNGRLHRRLDGLDCRPVGEWWVGTDAVERGPGVSDLVGRRSQVRLSISCCRRGFEAGNGGDVHAADQARGGVIDAVSRRAPIQDKLQSAHHQPSIVAIPLAIVGIDPDGRPWAAVSQAHRRIPRSARQGLPPPSSAPQIYRILVRPWR